MSPVRFASLIVACATALAFAVSSTGCGGREQPQLEYTYQKSGVTQQQLLDDERAFQQTSGVVRIITKLDDKGHARVELYVDERNKIPGLERAQELGYQQIHN
jgi:hypothetical protein